MAEKVEGKVKLVAVRDHRFRKKHVAKGKVQEFDLDDENDADFVAQLIHAGCLAEASPENLEKIEGEIKADKAREARTLKAHGIEPEKEPKK